MGQTLCKSFKTVKCCFHLSVRELTSEFNLHKKSQLSKKIDKRVSLFKRDDTIHKKIKFF